MNQNVSDNIDVCEIKLYLNDLLVATLLGGVNGYTFEPEPGTYRIKIIVAYFAGNSNSVTIIVTVKSPPTRFSGISRNTFIIIVTVVSIVSIIAIVTWMWRK